MAYTGSEVRPGWTEDGKTLGLEGSLARGGQPQWENAVVPGCPEHTGLGQKIFFCGCGRAGWAQRNVAVVAGGGGEGRGRRTEKSEGKAGRAPTI